jgi:hypothetical protein
MQIFLTGRNLEVTEALRSQFTVDGLLQHCLSASVHCELSAVN